MVMKYGEGPQRVHYPWALNALATQLVVNPHAVFSSARKYACVFEISMETNLFEKLSLGISLLSVDRLSKNQEEEEEKRFPL